VWSLDARGRLDYRNVMSITLGTAGRARLTIQNIDGNIPQREALGLPRDTFLTRELQAAKCRRLFRISSAIML